LDGTVNAGRKGIAYLRDHYHVLPLVTAGAVPATDKERVLVATSARQR
jgi:hypothetical protein